MLGLFVAAVLQYLLSVEGEEPDPDSEVAGLRTWGGRTGQRVPSASPSLYDYRLLWHSRAFIRNQAQAMCTISNATRRKTRMQVPLLNEK